MITAFAKGSIKELEIIEGYKRIVTPLVGAELFSSNANEVREALTNQRLNEIQPVLYLYIRGAIRDQAKDKVPETGWSGPIVLQEFLGYAILRQACFSLVSPTLASVYGEYLYTRMKSMEVSNMCLFILYTFLFCLVGASSSRSTAISAVFLSLGKHKRRNVVSKIVTKCWTR